MEYETRSLPGQLAVKSDGRTIVGYAIVYNSLSNPLPGGFREVIKPGAASHLLAGDVRALVEHDISKPIGRTTAGTLKLSEDARGVRFEIKTPNTGYAADLLENIRSGNIDGMSFRFKASAGAVAWKQTADGVVREISKFDRMPEISATTFPAYSDTTLAIRSMPAWVERSISSLSPKSQAIRQRMVELTNE